MTLVVLVAAVLAATIAALRWLRVAQREHYLPGSVAPIAWRWWWMLGFNRVLLAAVVLGAIGSFVSSAAGIAGSAAVLAGPFGLSVRGRAPGPLSWTRRLRTLAALVAGLYVVIVLLGWAVDEAAAAAVVGGALMPVVVDAALQLAVPIERRLAQRWVDRAASRLRSINPEIVAITGSYGKTTTKGYIAHLVAGARTVVPSPASFNNTLGLARAVNEHLVPGTDVFVAEMGTYGPREIAEMCAWVKPRISAITAIGPVHLERFKTEDRIVKAKQEIFEGAEIAVLNVDDDRLRAVADRLEREGRRVLRAGSKDPSAAVRARREGDALVVTIGDEEIARAEGLEVAPTNVAVAVSIAIELGTPRDTIARLLPTLPTAPNRLTVGVTSTGGTVLDDTFNSNPAGAAAALQAALRRRTGGNKVVVVTPGMIELGPRQADENRAFARLVGANATHLIVVGYTNRRALIEGARDGAAQVLVVDRRDDAVAWVKENVVQGDVVLYENDLPDHYP